MLLRLPRYLSSLSLGRLVVYSLVILLCTPWVPAGVAAAESAVHPELLELAAYAPDTQTPVIVQIDSLDERVVQRIARLGGVITQELGIIRSLAVVLPASAIPELGRTPGVRWISLDGPVESNSAQAFSRYFLHNTEPGTDTPSQAVLPLSQSAPTTLLLYNYDRERDSGPGLLIRRGGTLESPAESGLIQRWQVGPFNTDVRFSGNSFVQMYAAPRNYEKGVKATLVGHLLRVEADGQTKSLITSGSATRTWSGSWQSIKVKFAPVDVILDVGQSLELVLTVDGNSAADMWLAYGTRLQPSWFRATLQDALINANNFYLVNSLVDTEEDTTAHPVLPISARKSTNQKLPNYDADRDNQPGLLIKQGGTLTSSAGSSRIQRWRFSPFAVDTQLGPNVEFEIYATTRNFNKNRYGKLWAYLLHLNADGDLIHVLGSGSVEAQNWGETWHAAVIPFNNSTYAFPAGHQLEIAVTVDETSSQPMMLAYGTEAHPAQLKGELWTLTPQVYLDTIGVRDVWTQGYQGEGIRVAVIDSGIQPDMPDFMRQDGDGTQSRIIENVGIGTNPNDEFGHGTFVAGVIGSNGAASGGYYKGVAPQVDLINVRVSDEWGGAYESTVVTAAQWVLEHKDEYNIRVVNLSLNSSTLQSYNNSPLDAAVEILWFNGIVVVVSAGNNASTAPEVVYPPANDPFVIAVGSTDDLETATPTDDVLAAEFSVFGTTPDGFFRPDIVTPGTYIISALADASNFKTQFPYYHQGVIDASGNLVKLNFIASGTSISSGMVAGAAALLLQARPDLNPDQVKYLLMESATPLEGQPGVGSGSLNIAKAIEMALSYGEGVTVPMANTGKPASGLLTSGDDPIQWNSVNWNSVNWNSVNWNSVNWNSVNWNSTDPGDDGDSTGGDTGSQASDGTTGANLPASITIPMGTGHTLRPPVTLESDTLPSEDLPKVEPEKPAEPAEPEKPAEPEQPQVPAPTSEMIFLPILRQS